MKSLFKSTTAAIAVAMIGIAMVSLAPASATTIVRDHRDAPVVRDHRDGSTGGGVVVKDSPAKPKSVKIHYKNPVCLGPLCF